MNYVKVAVIDTGVDPRSVDCTKIRGHSLLRAGGAESRWWVSKDPHGTWTAKIITELDPFCELLVAKVGDAYNGITTESVRRVGAGLERVLRTQQ